MSKPSPDPRAAVEVFYDGACPLCLREVGIYQRMNGGDGLDWRDVSATCPAPDLTQEDALARFHVRRADGSLAVGAEAWAALWRAMPSLARWGRLLDRQPFLTIGAIGYRGFLLIRPLLQRLAGHRPARGPSSD